MPSVPSDVPHLIRGLQPGFKPKLPINIASASFIRDAFPTFDWLLENEPVPFGKLSVIKAYLPARFDDCETVLKSGLFTRRRSRARGGNSKSAYPGSFLMPKVLQLVTSGMNNSDDPEHRRLRSLVQLAFTPQAMGRLETRIETIVDQLVTSLEGQREVDLVTAFSTPIPVKVITEMVGVPSDEVDNFENAFPALTNGLKGMGVLKTMYWDLPRIGRYVDGLIHRKRSAPSDDILSGLITSNVDGDTLTHDEIKALVFLLVLAGYETTMHLITNMALMLLLHPEQKEAALSDPALMDAALEETLRFHGPIHSTEIMYALEDVTLSGVTIPKKSAVFPLLGAANRDPEKYDNPRVFDIHRPPRKHLGFGTGIHFCLGAALARTETKLAMTKLFERFPNAELAIDPDALEVEPVPTFRRYKRFPIRLNG